MADLAGSACRRTGRAPLNAACTSGRDCESAFCGAGQCTEPCFDDAAACGSPTRCVAFSDGRFCFPTCRRDDQCVANAVCTDVFVEGRICFRRGRVSTGERCTGDLQCRSGQCADGRCLAPCAAGLCPAGGRCLDFPSGPFCANDPRPLLAECGVSEDCAGLLSCIGGMCLPFCNEAGQCAPGQQCHAQLCHLSCEADSDCALGRRCNLFDDDAGLCQDPGPLPEGAVCRESSECADGLCFDGLCRTRCVMGVA